jgi:hypothetical protein
MFTDLFHLVQSLEHEFREENGNKVHSHLCLRCALTDRLNGFRVQIKQILRDIDFTIGDPDENK